MTAHAADEVFDRQRAERYSVRAVLLTDVPQNVVGDGSTSDKITAPVRWTDPDGSAHTDKTLVDTGQKAGSRIVVWTEGRGEISVAPRTSTEAAVEAGVLATRGRARLSRPRLRR